MNEWMNDEAVYRTAPATPGLLNIAHSQVLVASKFFFFGKLNQIYLIYMNLSEYLTSIFLYLHELTCNFLNLPEVSWINLDLHNLPEIT